MKRALVVLLALVMGAGLLFAADAPALKWQGWIRTGAGFYTQETGTTFEDYNYDRVGGDRIRLAFSYTSADAVVGFYSRLSLADSNWKTNTVNAAGFHRIYGWANLFNKMLKIKAGVLDDYTIATADWNGFGNTDTAVGLYFNLAPMAGLNVGFFQALPYSGAVDAADFYSGDLVGLSYAIPNIGAVQLGASLVSESNTTNVYTAPWTFGTATYAWFGFNLTAVKNLTAILENKVQFFSDATAFFLEQHVAYTMGSLTAGAYVGEVYDGTDFYFGVEPSVSYKLNDKLSVGVIANVYNNKSQTFMSPIDAGVVGDNTVHVPGDMNFGAGASVTYVVGGARLVLGDYYAAATGAGNIVYFNVDVSF